MYINLNNNFNTSRLMTNNRINNINTNNILSKTNNLNKNMKNISKENSPLQKLTNRINMKTEFIKSSEKEDIKEKIQDMKKLNSTEKIKSMEKAHKEKMKEFEVIKGFLNYTKNISINETIKSIDQAIKYENKSAEGKLVHIEGVTPEQALEDYINHGERNLIFDDIENEAILVDSEKEFVQFFIDIAKKTVKLYGSLTKLLYTFHKDGVDKVIDRMENETGESINTEKLFYYDVKTLGIQDIDTNKMNHEDIISRLGNAKKTLQSKISKINLISDKLDEYINEKIKPYNTTSKYAKNEFNYNNMKLELDFQIKSKLIESISSNKEDQKDEKDEKFKNDCIKVV